MPTHSAWRRRTGHTDSFAQPDIDEKDQLASRSHRRTCGQAGRQELRPLLHLAMRAAPKFGDCACARDSYLARTLGAISSSRCQISRGGEKPISRSMAAKRMLPGRTQTRWWSQTGSNRRPPACKAGALPTELWPLRDQKISHQTVTRLAHDH